MAKRSARRHRTNDFFRRRKSRQSKQLNQARRRFLSAFERLEDKCLLAANIFQESFELPPGPTYTLSAQFDSGTDGFDYFNRYAVPDNSNAARDDFQLGWDGSFGIQGQDHDDGTGQPATQKITIPGINIAGQGNLQATIAVGALDSEPAFNNFEAADGDQIEIYANVDGGGRTLIGRFAPPADGAGDLYLDTDLDGIGDGPNLTVELQDFSFAIPSSGASLDLEIELTSTDSFESLALDNVRVEVPKLLLTELVVTPTGGEFIEIHNPDGVTVDLSDYYLTDATFAGGGTFYYNIVTGSNAGGGGFSDFLARFPTGATIAPGEYQTIALNGSDNFNTAYGINPTYELYEDGGAADAIPDMREGLVGSINDQGGLTNGGEVVVFFQWDGNSDLVIDVDYALWGDKDEAIDKSGVAIDGPDGGTATSSYQNDTAIASQDVIDTGSHAGGQSWQRIDLTEGAQITVGGNGIAGNDETSEDLSNTWATFTPTPNAPFSADNGQPPVFEQTGPFGLSANAPAGTAVGDVDANDGDGADLGVTYSLIGDQMMVGQNGFNVTPILTVGDTLAGTSGALNASTAGDYQPVGILDGLGAYELDANTVRVFVNHELTSSAGATYGLANGSTLTGARISYFDIDKSTRQIVDGGLAYDTIINAAGVPVDDINKADIGSGGGLARLCSAQLVHGGTFGFVDTIFFSGEEDSAANGGLGGLEYGLDAASGILYALPAMGYAAWENVTPLETGDANTIALLVGDDRAGAPLYLYVGNKGLDANGAAASDFMSRNGLANGTLYHWKADNGDTTPDQFNGTGGSRTGTWVELTDLSSIAAQDAEVATNGGFTFSRPEDVATDPNNPTRAVFSSTGRGGLFPSDNWGTLYVIDVTFGAGGVPTTGDIEILYDGDDAGGGQFAGPDFGLRSPDNLDWADDGLIYVQEDRSTSPSSAFGGVSGQEASIWQVNPADGSIQRVAQIDRSAVLPWGSTDSSPGDIGNWESSGVLDVSTLFGEAPGSLLIFDVQAHAITDGEIGANQLVEGGQLAFLEMGVETAGTFRINPNTGVITTTSEGVFSGSESVDLTVLADDGFETATATVTVNLNSDPVTTADQIRFATFNTSLSGPDLPAQLSTPDDFNAQRIAEIVQRTNPDVILLNEFNFDPAGVSADLFRENYLEISQNGADPVYYPYVFNAPSNTGIDSGFDLDNDGATGGDGDAFGFGSFEGQFGMLLLSKYPILEGEVCTFQQFLWKDMPGGLLPLDPMDADGNGDFDNWFTAAELDVVRLSSKSHWDVPIDFDGQTIHALASHPTPPVFDGPEDRNGTRNHDEIRFWADYIDPAQSGYIYDDVEFAAAGFTRPDTPSGGLAMG